MVVMDSEHRLQEGDRVCLRNHVDPSLYQGMSTLCNEGVIRKVREDNFGLPQVYIEWDKNHWSYNGAPDCWTFEDHFDIVKRMSKKPSKHELASQFANLFAELMSDEEPEAQPEPTTTKGDDLQKRLTSLLPSEDELDLTQSSEDDQQTRSKAIKDINEVIEDAEAFVLVAVNRIDHPKAENGVMVPHAITWAQNPVGELLSLVHMAGLSSQSFQDLALQTIQALGSSDDD